MTEIVPVTTNALACTVRRQSGPTSRLGIPGGAAILPAASDTITTSRGITGLCISDACIHARGAFEAEDNVRRRRQADLFATRFVKLTQINF